MPMDRCHEIRESWYISNELGYDLIKCLSILYCYKRYIPYRTLICRAHPRQVNLREAR